MLQPSRSRHREKAANKSDRQCDNPPQACAIMAQEMMGSARKRWSITAFGLSLD